MPWTIDDAPARLSPDKRKRWVRIANEVRAKCLEDGTEKECDAKAVIIANSALAEWYVEYDFSEGSSLSGNYGHAGIPGSRGGSMPGGGHSALGVGRGASDEEKKEAVSKRREERKAATGKQREETVIPNDESALQNTRKVERLIGDLAYAKIGSASNFTVALREVVASDLAEQSGVPFDIAAQAMTRWSASSNNSLDVLAIQAEAARLSKGELTPWQQSRQRALEAQWADSENKGRGITDDQVRNIVSAQYANTQRELASAGFASDDVLKVYRATVLPEKAAAALSGKPAVVKDNALVSVSTRREEAEAFGWESIPPGFVRAVETLYVKRSAVFSTPVTGLGSYRERELVVFGRDNIATIEKT